jgi:dTDP-4-dehydrorhamnose reductase
MLSLAAKGINPKVVEDQKGCPTYARDLAGVVAVLLTKIEELDPGVYNFCNAGETTWFGFARAIYKATGLKVDVAPITTAEFGALAPRPSYSVLDTTLIHEKTGVVPRKWNVALQDCIARLSDIMSNDN